MPTDLSTQLRALVDVADPVSADEAMTRAESYPTELDGSVTSLRNRYARPAAVAASAVLIASAGIAIGLSAEHSAPPKKLATPTQHPKMILTAAEVRSITSHSTAAAASSGTAQVTETGSQYGAAQDNEITVTFDGSNIDEKITVHPEPLGSGKTFTTDDRLVDGEFYIFTPGPGTGDVSEWLHDTGNDNPAASMQFPDPRTLYGALDAGANFEVTGTSTADGTTLTQLTALEPAAIDATALDNLANGPLTAFSMTVDENNVVQQMSFSSSSTSRVCNFSAADFSAVQAQLRKEHLESPSGKSIVRPAEIAAAAKAAGIVQTCTQQTSDSHVNVVFSNLGGPESVTAPQGAVDYQGKG